MACRYVSVVSRVVAMAGTDVGAVVQVGGAVLESRVIVVVRP